MSETPKFYYRLVNKETGNVRYIDWAAASTRGLIGQALGVAAADKQYVRISNAEYEPYQKWLARKGNKPKTL